MWCGANSMLQLVLARGLQGVGGGMLVGSAFASVIDLFPETLERVRWQVMLSASFGIASAVGPILGGWMTEHLGWRSVFYVNLPVGLIALPMVWYYLPHIVHSKKDIGKTIDWLGVLLLTLTIGMLLAATELSGYLGFISITFWSLVALSIIFAGLFLRHQHHTNAPIIPPILFADSTVRRLGLLATLTGLIMFVLLFYAPLLLQGGFSLSPKEAGILVTPILVGITVGSIVNGRLIPRVKWPERLFSRGILLLTVSMGMLCGVSVATPHELLLLIFSLCGLSLGFQLPNLTLQMQSAVKKEDQGAASALIQTLRTLGSMFGASLAGLMVSLGFNHGAVLALTNRGIHDPQVWKLFENPQLLVRGADQAMLINLGLRQGFDGVNLLEQARAGLVSGVHQAFLGCLLLALISYFISRRLPPFLKG